MLGSVLDFATKAARYAAPVVTLFNPLAGAALSSAPAAITSIRSAVAGKTPLTTAASTLDAFLTHLRKV